MIKPNPDLDPTIYKELWILKLSMFNTYVTAMGSWEGDRFYPALLAVGD